MRLVQKVFDLAAQRSRSPSNQQLQASAGAGNHGQGLRYETTVRVSMFEIYNDEVRDLLLPPGREAVKLEIRTEKQSNNGGGSGKAAVASLAAMGGLDGGGGAGGPALVQIPGLTTLIARSAQDVMAHFARGLALRATAATSIHDHSSRSHCILRIEVESTAVVPPSTPGGGGGGAQLAASLPSTSSTAPALPPSTIGRLYLVDLAGSERVRKSAVIGPRLKEAQYINKSLSALGDVLESLDKKQAHVPYRNSKLTHILQDSLGGAARTLLICNVCPGAFTADETLYSLQFASRARNIDLGPAQRVVAYRNVMDAYHRLRADAASSEGARAAAIKDLEVANNKVSELQQRLESARSEGSKATEQARRALAAKVDQLQAALVLAKAEVAAERKLRAADNEAAALAQSQLKKDNHSLAVQGRDKRSSDQLLVAAQKEVVALRQQLNDTRSQLAYLRKQQQYMRTRHADKGRLGDTSIGVAGVDDAGPASYDATDADTSSTQRHAHNGSDASHFGYQQDTGTSIAPATTARINASDLSAPQQAILASTPQGHASETLARRGSLASAGAGGDDGTAAAAPPQTPNPMSSSSFRYKQMDANADGDSVGDGNFNNASPGADRYPLDDESTNGDGAGFRPASAVSTPSAAIQGLTSPQLASHVGSNAGSAQSGVLTTGGAGGSQRGLSKMLLAQRERRLKREQDMLSARKAAASAERRAKEEIKRAVRAKMGLPLSDRRIVASPPPLPQAAGGPHLSRGQSPHAQLQPSTSLTSPDHPSAAAYQSRIPTTASSRKRHSIGDHSQSGYGHAGAAASRHTDANDGAEGAGEPTPSSSSQQQLGERMYQGTDDYGQTIERHAHDPDYDSNDRHYGSGDDVADDDSDTGGGRYMVAVINPSPESPSLLASPGAAVEMEGAAASSPASDRGDDNNHGSRTDPAGNGGVIVSLGEPEAHYGSHRDGDGVAGNGAAAISGHTSSAPVTPPASTGTLAPSHFDTGVITQAQSAVPPEVGSKSDVAAPAFVSSVSGSAESARDASNMGSQGAGEGSATAAEHGNVTEGAAGQQLHDEVKDTSSADSNDINSSTIGTLDLETSLRSSRMSSDMAMMITPATTTGIAGAGGPSIAAPSAFDDVEVGGTISATDSTPSSLHRSQGLEGAVGVDDAALHPASSPLVQVPQAATEVTVVPSAPLTVPEPSQPASQSVDGDGDLHHDAQAAATAAVDVPTPTTAQQQAPPAAIVAPSAAPASASAGVIMGRGSRLAAASLTFDYNDRDSDAASSVDDGAASDIDDDGGASSGGYVPTVLGSVNASPRFHGTPASAAVHVIAAAPPAAPLPAPSAAHPSMAAPPSSSLPHDTSADAANGHGVDTTGRAAEDARPSDLARGAPMTQAAPGAENDGQPPVRPAPALEAPAASAASESAAAQSPAEPAGAVSALEVAPAASAAGGDATASAATGAPSNPVVPARPGGAASGPAAPATDEHHDDIDDEGSVDFHDQDEGDLLDLLPE